MRKQVNKMLKQHGSFETARIVCENIIISYFFTLMQYIRAWINVLDLLPIKLIENNLLWFKFWQVIFRSSL